jgi:hypothetical protein
MFASINILIDFAIKKNPNRNLNIAQQAKPKTQITIYYR